MSYIPQITQDPIGFVSHEDVGGFDVVVAVAAGVHGFEGSEEIGEGWAICGVDFAEVFVGMVGA